MTETTFETETVSDCSDVLRNKVLEQVLLESMKETGAPVWTEEEYRFAERISENVAEGLKRKAHSEYHLDGQVYRGLHTGIYDGSTGKERQWQFLRMWGMLAGACPRAYFHLHLR